MDEGRRNYHLQRAAAQKALAEKTMCLASRTLRLQMSEFHKQAAEGIEEPKYAGLYLVKSDSEIERRMRLIESRLKG